MIFEGLSRAEWHNAVVEEKEDAAVLRLEEAYVHDRGLILDWLMEQPEYAGAITGLYFLAQEEGGAFLETNDAEGRYFPEREIDGEKLAVVPNTPYSQRQWVTYTATINLPDGKEMKLDFRKKI